MCVWRDFPLLYNKANNQNNWPAAKRWCTPPTALCLYSGEWRQFPPHSEKWIWIFPSSICDVTRHTWQNNYNNTANNVFVISHDLQKRVVDKEQEKQKISDDTKELAEKNTKIEQEMEKMNQELKNVEK